MSVNKYLPHVYVIPEDDVDRRLANGFQLGVLSNGRQIQVLNEAGGWLKVVECFKKEHIPELERYPKRFVVLLIDFDKQQNRLNDVKTEIPEHLNERVFVLGVWSEPEDLKSDLRQDYEKIGLALAKDCCDNTNVTWTHDLFRHNANELARLRKHVRPILFSATEI